MRATLTAKTVKEFQMTAADLFNLAWSYAQAGHYAHAEQLYRQVVAADPNHADAYRLLGILAAQSGRREMAIGYHEQAVALQPYNADFHFDLAVAYRTMGRRDD